MSDLEMYRGDDRTIVITSPEDLTGSAVRWTAKASRYDDEPALIEKSTEDASIDVDTFTATVRLDAADTEDLAPGPLWWDVEITDTLGKVRTMAMGELTLKADVTRTLA